MPPSPYRLISRESYPEYRDNRLVRPVSVGGVSIGGGETVVIAGPCAVEGREHTLSIARAAKEAGAKLLRGGAFKPRTSPYEFQGLGTEGLEILAEVRAETGLPIVTEVLDPREVEQIAEVADCLQIGARSMQNFPLLREAGRAGLPVLLKRHWSASLTEWLCAAEYVAVEGNLEILLCERGIRTFSFGDYNRNTLDLNVLAALRARTFLPVVVDPSHGTGSAEMVLPAARAGIAIGADALLVEMVADSTDIGTIQCDAQQAVRPEDIARIVRECECWERCREAAEALATSEA